MPFPRWLAILILALLAVEVPLLRLALKDERAHQQYLQQHCRLTHKESHSDWKYDVVLHYIKHYDLITRTYACDDGRTLSETEEY